MSYTDSVLDQAQQAVTEGRLDDAQTIIAPILAAEPNNSRAWAILADATLDQTEADQYRAKVVELAKSSPTNAAIQPPQTKPIITYPQQSPYFNVPLQKKPTPLVGGAILVGAGLISLGAFLPWVVFRDELSKTSLLGINTYGIFTLGLGVILALLGVWLMRPRTWGKYATTSIAVLCAVVTMLSMTWTLALARRDADTISIGLGVYVTLVGAFVAWASGYLDRPNANSFD